MKAWEKLEQLEKEKIHLQKIVKEEQEKCSHFNVNHENTFTYTKNLCLDCGKRWKGF